MRIHVHTSFLLNQYTCTILPAAHLLAAPSKSPKTQHHQHSANELWCRSSDDDDDETESKTKKRPAELPANAKHSSKKSGGPRQRL